MHRIWFPNISTLHEPCRGNGQCTRSKNAAIRRVKSLQSPTSFRVGPSSKLFLDHNCSIIVLSLDYVSISIILVSKAHNSKLGKNVWKMPHDDSSKNVHNYCGLLNGARACWRSIPFLQLFNFLLHSWSVVSHHLESINVISEPLNVPLRLNCRQR